MRPSHFYPVSLTGCLLALSACVSALPATAEQRAPVLGLDLGSSGRAPMPKRTAMAVPRDVTVREPAMPGKVQLAQEGHGGTRAIGTVNVVDPAKRTVNLSHQPIPALGWPAMTMDFAVAPAVDLKEIRPGAAVTVTLGKGKNGIYEIRSMEPAGGGR